MQHGYWGSQLRGSWPTATSVQVSLKFLFKYKKDLVLLPLSDMFICLWMLALSWSSSDLFLVPHFLAVEHSIDLLFMFPMSLSHSAACSVLVSLSGFRWIVWVDCILELQASEPHHVTQQEIPTKQHTSHTHESCSRKESQPSHTLEQIASTSKTSTLGTNGHDSTKKKSHHHPHYKHSSRTTIQLQRPLNSWVSSSVLGWCFWRSQSFLQPPTLPLSSWDAQW